MGDSMRFLVRPLAEGLPRSTLAYGGPSSRRLSNYLPQIYVAISLPALIFFAFAMPPFQNPDEKGHFMRAYQVAHGAILAEVRGDETGGAVDNGLRDLWLLTEPIWGNSSRKYPEDVRREARSFEWTGVTTYQQFNNQAFYGPLLYLPQGGAIRLGSLLGLSVADTMILARLFLGFAVVAIGATVLVRLRHGRHMAFLFLTLPMTLAMTASTSQDGLQIVVGMAIIALALNWAVSDTPPSVPAALGFVAAIVVLSWGRVVMAALALLLAGAAFGRVPLPVPRGKWPRRLALGAVCAGLVVAVSAIQAAAMSPQCGLTSPRSRLICSPIRRPSSASPMSRCETCCRPMPRNSSPASDGASCT
jgi:hypothetical protein